MRLKMYHLIFRTWCVLIFVFPFYGFQISAQPVQTKRYENKQENGDNGYTVIPLKQKGLAIIRDKEKYKEGKKIWELILLDTALQEKHLEEFDIESRLNLIGYEHVDNQIYLLFRKTETDVNDFLLIKTNLDTYSSTRHEIKQELNFKITHFTIAGGSAIFGGYITREPAVLLYVIASEQKKIVPGFFLADTELLDLRINHNNTFNTLLIERGSKENKKLIIKTFDEWGSLLLEDAITIPSDRAILSGITSALEREELILLGTWGAAKSNQAAGLFSVLVDPFREQPIQFYNFGELSHFFEYMGAKRAEKTFIKSKRKQMAGKIPDFKANVNVVKMQEYEDGFSLLTEVYTPTSSLNSSPYWNSYANPYGNPYAYGYNPYGFNPFGPRYYNSPYSYYNPSPNSDVIMNHSSIVVFDTQGKIKSDYGFKLNGLRQSSLEQASDYLMKGNKVFAAFKNEEEINVKTWIDDSIVQDTLTVTLKHPADKLRQEYNQNTGVRHWFDSAFYVWGYEAIKDTEKSEETRHVFYINKLEVK